MPSASAARAVRLKRNTLNGTWQALTVAFLQSVEGVIFPLINLVPAIYGLIAIQHFDVSVAISTTVAMEGVAMVGTLAFYGPKVWLEAMGCMTRRSGRLIVMGVMMGTVTGNICFKVAVLFGGSSYGTILSSIYPVFAIVGSVIMLRQRYDHRTYVFAAINAVLGGLFILLPAVVKDDNAHFEFAKQGVGILLSLLAAFFWAIESLLIRQGMRDSRIKESHVLNLRVTVSLFTNGVFLLPLAGLIAPDVHNAYSVFVQVLSHYEIWLICVALGISLVFLRLAHTAALNNIGTAKTAVIDANYLVITPCLAYAVSAIMGIYATDPTSQLFVVWFEYDRNLIPWWGFLLILGIVASLLPTLYFASRTDTGPGSLKEHIN